MDNKKQKPVVVPAYLLNDFLAQAKAENVTVDAVGVDPTETQRAKTFTGGAPMKALGDLLPK